MKDLTKRDIPVKSPLLFTTYVELNSGSWMKMDPPTADKIIDGAEYTKIGKQFGVLGPQNTNVSKPSFRGRPGDYLVKQKSGNLKIITKEQYNKLFPVGSRSKPKFKPTNSRSL